MNDRQLAVLIDDFEAPVLRRLGFMRWLFERGRLAADTTVAKKPEPVPEPTTAGSA